MLSNYSYSPNNCYCGSLNLEFNTFIIKYLHMNLFKCFHGHFPPLLAIVVKFDHP